MKSMNAATMVLMALGTAASVGAQSMSEFAHAYSPKRPPTYSGGNKSSTKVAKERARKKVTKKSRQMQRRAAKR